MRTLLSTRHVFLAVVFLGLFGMAIRDVTDPDVWWHLKTGELIAATRAVPHADSFSSTRAGQPWIAHEWLSDLVIYGLYRAAGWSGLILVFAAVVCAAFLLLYLRCGGNSYASGIFVLCGAWASAPLWGVRPQMLSFLLTSLWLFILERSERRPHLISWTLPITLLWVNLHAGFALGLALLILFLSGELLEQCLKGSPAWKSNPRIYALAAMFVFNLLLVIVNPNGATMYEYPLATLRSRAMQHYIAEWASPNFHRADYWPFLVLLLGATAAVSWSRVRPRRRDILLLVISTFAALSSIRMIPFFVLIAVPIVCKSLTQPGPFRNAVSRSDTTLRYVFHAAILMGMAGFVSVHAVRVIRHQSQAEAEHFPVAAVAYLRAHPVPGRLFNYYDWGGYLIWYLYPSTPVFVDGRADVYGEGLLYQFAETYQLRGNWQQTFTEWRVGTVIVPKNSALAQGLQAMPGWSARYQDQQAVVFSTMDGRAALTLAPGPPLTVR